MFVIEKGVPVAPDVERRVYPWGTMEVGDSIYVEGKDAANLAWTAARTQASRTSMRFRQRRELSGNRRIWRIA